MLFWRIWGYHSAFLWGSGSAYCRASLVEATCVRDSCCCLSRLYWPLASRPRHPGLGFRSRVRDSCCCLSRLYWPLASRPRHPGLGFRSHHVLESLKVILLSKASRTGSILVWGSRKGRRIVLVHFPCEALWTAPYVFS